MKNSVTLTIPSDFGHFKLIKSTAKKLVKPIFKDKRDTKALLRALKELVENAIVHGYKDHGGEIAVTFHPFAYGIRVDVRDWGLPMSSTKHKSVPIKDKADEGFNRIYNLTDRFDYVNMGREGKLFYIVKYAAGALISQEPLLPSLMAEQEDDEPQKGIEPAADTDILIRPFLPGDEEAIANLIYKNYGHSYIKDTFYFPQKILQYEGEKILSIVAQTNDEIVGHFALVRMEDSNIAEVGITVVDPRFKGRGIMNRMFDAVIEQARTINLDAVFAEAIMYHPFSQKSNLRHAFVETSMQIGKIPGEVRLKGGDINEKRERGAVLISFRLLKPQQKSVFLPARYEFMLQKSYASFGEITVTVTEKHEKKEEQHTQLSYIFEPITNVSTIVINRYGDDFAHKFHIMLNHLQGKQCDMIYADINLETIPEIDKVVAILNNALFFYCGLQPLKHGNRDYLQLQYKHSHTVGKKNMVCYSEFWSCTNISCRTKSGLELFQKADKDFFELFKLFDGSALIGGMDRVVNDTELHRIDPVFAQEACITCPAGSPKFWVDTRCLLDRLDDVMHNGRIFIRQERLGTLGEGQGVIHLFEIFMDKRFYIIFGRFGGVADVKHHFKIPRCDVGHLHPGTDIGDDKLAGREELVSVVQVDSRHKRQYLRNLVDRVF